MSGYKLGTHSGDIWGSPAQKAAQLKAAKASAEKRRKNQPDPQDRRDRSLAEVMSNPHDYPSRDAHTDAIIAAKRRERLAAGHGPAVIPKGKALAADGTLKDAENKAPVRPQLQSERIQARIDKYKAELAQPDTSTDGRRHEVLAKAIRASYVDKRGALSNEDAQVRAAEQAAKSPEEKAHDEVRYARNRWEAGVRDLRATIAKYPGSMSAEMAQRQLDGLLSKEPPVPGAAPKPAGHDAAKAQADAHNAALAAWEAEHGAKARANRSDAAKRAAATRKARAQGGIPEGVNMNSEHNQMALLMGAARPKKSRAQSDSGAGLAASSKTVKLELRGGSTATGVIVADYDTFKIVKLKDGTNITVPKNPGPLDHQIITRKR